MNTDRVNAGPSALSPGTGLVIDCDTCTVRGDACGDCVVSVLLGGVPGPMVVEAAEVRALDVLSRSGLVPALRMQAPCGESPDSSRTDLD